MMDSSTDLLNSGSVESVPLLDVGRGNAPLKAEIMELFSDCLLYTSPSPRD